MTFRTLYCPDLPASQSPFRVVDENGCELVWANRFLDAQYLRGLAPLSLRGYANTLLHFVRWWSHQPGVQILEFRAENFTESTLVDYVRSQVDQNPRPTPENINNRSYMLKRLFRFYFQQDMPHSPYCIQRQWNRPVECGRRGPMPSADLFSEAQVHVRGKGQRVRRVPLPPETIRLLRSYLQTERPLTNQPEVFVSLKGRSRGRAMTPAGLRSLFRHHRHEADVRNANPHRFRHTFGSDMVRAGVSLPALMRLMGHAHIHTTLLYIQLTPQDVFDEYTRAVARITQRERKSLP